MPFKKGSKEAKDHMLKLRNMRLNGSQTELSLSKPKPKKKSEFPIKPKRVVKQTGTSDRYLDSLKKALPPGKRISKNTGVAYYEVRKNRSDAKGKLTGVSTNAMITFYNFLLQIIIKDLKYSNEQINNSYDTLEFLNESLKDKSNTLNIKTSIKKNIVFYKKYIKEMEEHTKELKKILSN